MKIVLDTNVLVSGLLSPFGPPGEIVRMVSSGALELCFDARILSEYREVLKRPRFKIDLDDMEALLEQIEACGHPVAASPLLRGLPDKDDEPFLEVALAGAAECLVTGNQRHFPKNRRQGVVVVTPREFLTLFRERK
jgi:putative PIN family toxin of toxin-antitoxin system